MTETVGGILARNPQWEGEGEPQPETKPAPCMPARLDGQPEFPTPGIYFGMTDADYHAIFACSSSVIKDMSVSPMYAWAKSPLNPEREDDDTFAKMLGRAYHVRICEGSEAYGRSYALALDRSDYPDALATTDDLIAAIIDAGGVPMARVETGQTKPAPTLKEPDRVKPVTRAAKKEDLIAQLLALNPNAQIWDQLLADHAEFVGDRAMIRSEDDRRIQIAARMIEADPELSKVFSEGYAEVSLFWYDDATGAPCKARADYLRYDGFSDLKSFSLKSEMPVERAIIREIANRRHFIPVCHYSDGIEAVKALVRDHGEDAIFNLTAGSPSDWAQKWANVKGDPVPIYVFQATGIAPITRGKIMPREAMGTFGVTHRRVEELRRSFVANVEVWGTDPWLDQAPLDTIEDTDIPMWATEI